MRRDPRHVGWALLVALTAVGLVIWHFMADRVMAGIVERSPFFAEESVAAEVKEIRSLSQIINPGYYTQLFVQEYSQLMASGGTEDAQNLRSFIEHHQTVFVSPPTIESETERAAYTAQLASLQDQVRPLHVDQLMVAIREQSREQLSSSLKEISRELDHNLSVLQSLTVPEGAQALHRYYLTALLYYKNGARRLVEFSRDPAGAALAADELDRMHGLFASLEKNGLTALVVPPERETVLGAVAAVLGHSSLAVSSGAAQRQVAGSQDVAPVIQCQLCLPLDDLLAKPVL